MTAGDPDRLVLRGPSGHGEEAAVVDQLGAWLRGRLIVHADSPGGELQLRWARDDGGLSLEAHLVADEPLPEPSPIGRAFLIVEDDEVAARSMARVLGRYGPTRTAGSVAAATALLARPGVWLGILADVGLPDGDGLEVVAQVRARDSAVPILVLTGAVDPARANRAQELDAEFAFKPLSAANLDRFSRRALARRRTTDRAVASVVARRAEDWGLTPRQVEVLAVAIGPGGGARARVAEAFGVSRNTAKVHLAAILKKAGGGKLSDLVQGILREAWLENPHR